MKGTKIENKNKNIFTVLSIIMQLNIVDQEATSSKIHPFQTYFQRHDGGDVMMTS